MSGQEDEQLNRIYPHASRHGIESHTRIGICRRNSQRTRELKGGAWEHSRIQISRLKLHAISSDLVIATASPHAGTYMVRNMVTDTLVNLMDFISSSVTDPCREGCDAFT